MSRCVLFFSQLAVQMGPWPFRWDQQRWGRPGQGEQGGWIRWCHDNGWVAFASMVLADSWSPSSLVLRTSCKLQVYPHPRPPTNVISKFSKFDRNKFKWFLNSCLWSTYIYIDLIASLTAPGKDVIGASEGDTHLVDSSPGTPALFDKRCALALSFVDTIFLLHHVKPSFLSLGKIDSSSILNSLCVNSTFILRVKHAFEVRWRVWNV